MADMNNFCCTGRLTSDAETRTIGAKGTLLTEFSIANNTGFGQYASTQFFKVCVWGQAGTAIAQYLKKGKQVGVSGTLENKKYTGRDGMQHDSWTITSSQVTLLADSKAAQGIAPSMDTASDEEDDSVAF